MSDVENLKDTLCSLEELPALPAVAVRILDKIKEPDTPMQQLAETLAMDPPLSAKVLSVVNSSYFGLPRRITNLPHAVNLLGEDSLKYIALSFSLINLFERRKGGFDYALFWKHSLTCALLSRIIAEALRAPDAEDLYFLGLIHNLGSLVLYQSHPRQYGLVIEKVEKGEQEFHTAENAVFGCNHMQVGAHLLEQWGLPRAFFLPLRHHHNPEELPAEEEEGIRRAQILDIAFSISRFMHEEGDDKALRLALIEQSLKEYEMKDLVQMEAVLESVSAQLEPLLPLFDLDANSTVDYLQLLEESKKEMFHLSFKMTRKLRTQEQTIEALSVLASQDGLTQLKNYQSFQESLNREISSTQRYGHTSVLALADLDSFKAVNDEFGHLAGDHALRVISRFFMDNIRKSDVIARYGGEEFVFILTRTDANDGYKIMDRLRAKLAGLSIEYRKSPISLTMSVGVTRISPDAPLLKNELLRQADTAMYRAKKAGRNRTVLYQSE